MVLGCMVEVDGLDSKEVNHGADPVTGIEQIFFAPTDDSGELQGAVVTKFGEPGREFQDVLTIWKINNILAGIAERLMKRCPEHFANFDRNPAPAKLPVIFTRSVKDCQN